MTLPPFRQILATTALCLAAVGLSSCVTLIDAGSMLDDMGKQRPSHQLQLVQEKPRYYEREEIQVWQKEGLYYVQLPVAYIPARVKDRDYLVLMGLYFSAQGGTYPRLIMNDEDVIQFQHTKEYFYAVLSEAQLNKAATHYHKYPNEFYRENYPVLAASEVDLSNAKKWKPLPSQKAALSVNAIYMFKQLPDRRTTGNQLRRPLVLVLDVADVPLSIVATPFAWVADFVTVCFCE